MVHTTLVPKRLLIKLLANYNDSFTKKRTKVSKEIFIKYNLIGKKCTNAY